MKNKELHGLDVGDKKCRLLYARFQKSSEPPAIILFLIRVHIVKSEVAARRLVVLVICIFFLLSIYLSIKALSNPSFIS